jgi:hypothetical protein
MELSAFFGDAGVDLGFKITKLEDEVGQYLIREVQRASPITIDHTCELEFTLTKKGRLPNAVPWVMRMGTGVR